MEKGFLRLTDPMGRKVLKFDGPSGRGLRIALRAILIKSALRDLLFCVIRYEKHYFDQPPPVASPPFGALRHHLPPAERWDNKALKGSLLICDSTVSTGYSATACGVASERNLQGPQGSRKFRETLSRGEVPRSGQGGISIARRAVVKFSPPKAV